MVRRACSPAGWPHLPRMASMAFRTLPPLHILKWASFLEGQALEGHLSLYWILGLCGYKEYFVKCFLMTKTNKQINKDVQFSIEQLWLVQNKSHSTFPQKRMPKLSQVITPSSKLRIIDPC